ncbi:long-chain fatty acid--CoA ligase [Kutzneria viridogrisea]|uniref:Acyl-coenzyme A synthetase/AMP-(Fatty) acid ligase n=2 Tax=Kutzneria TaxID=43356 RepID=A0ABR6BJF7_9PSEU|nr:AMP-binding protein [Kutzneria albida]AHH95620.1 putative acyl-CoA ligase [Kutzneria albida DSM 43870]MBA8927017.1 acyl-coenzyme A synthetase/AMP-(fatty) acid ligase [Kutzneria viridogrisea]
MRLVEDLLDRHPDDLPYLVADHVVTHGELREAVAHETALFASAGVGPGSTVALQVPPSFTQVEVLLALWRLGAQVMLIDHRLKPAEVDALRALCRPQFVVRAGAAGWSRLNFRARHELVTEKRSDGKPADTAHRLVQFSSGSTGLPKVIGRTESSLAEEIERFTRIEGMPKYGDRVLLLSSTAHSFGLIAGLLHSLAVGVTVVFAPRVAAADMLDAARKHEVTAIFGVPFHYELLGSLPTPPALPALRVAVSGGEIMPPEVAERFRLAYGVPVGESYGTTETGVIAMDVSGRQRPAVGPAAPGIRLRLVDGEVEVALEGTPYLTADGQERFVAGWLRTRDRAELTTGGGVRLLGRGDSLVVIGGLKVDLTEVEAVLGRHPAITEAVLVHGESIEAYVSTVDKAVAAEDLILWCRSFLADFKLPKSVWVLPQLPRTSNGKLIRERSVLRAAIS